MAEDKSSCVIGSVEGVSTALRMVAIKKIYFQDFSIWAEGMAPIRPSIICITGIWNAKPVLNNNINIKSKYCSNDHKGSTISAPYLIKKCRAAGISTLNEKYIPVKNKQIEAINMGKKNFVSVEVNPGRINRTTW